MNLLALDLGTKMGWAARNASGTYNLAPKRGENNAMRWIRFEDRLTELCSAGNIDRIIYERVDRHLGTQAAHIYGGFVAKLEEFCELHDVALMNYGPGEIKKFATGKGNAKKVDMIVAANRLRCCTYLTDDNEADAVCLWHMGNSSMRATA